MKRVRIVLSQIDHVAPSELRDLLDYCINRIPKRFKYGKAYIEFRKELNNEKNLTRYEISKIQLNKLKKLLVHAYETTVYYKQLFDNKGFNPYEMQSVHDMEKIPLLCKNDVQKNLKDMKSKKFCEDDFVPVTTGGTSGNQMKFFMQRNYTWSREKAITDYYFESGGCNNGVDAKAIIRNMTFNDAKLWKYNYRDNSLYIDTFHLTDENCKCIVKKLNKNKIKFFHVYPSAALILASYMERHNDYLQYKPKAVFATSENLYVGQKERIEKAFSCKLIGHYGHSEMSGIALGCPYHNHYHIEDLYGYLELIDEHDMVITEPNIRGEIVVTGFNNYALPFIRYRTGDYASYGENDCEYSNRRILKSIEGRWHQEMLIAPKGNSISMTSLNMHSSIFNNVLNYQFYQDKIGECELRIIKALQYCAVDEKNIYDAVKKKLGTDFKLKIVYVDNIEKAKSGKFRYIISKLV